jgi:hypothetical protein
MPWTRRRPSVWVPLRPGPAATPERDVQPVCGEQGTVDHRHLTASPLGGHRGGAASR